MMRLPQLVFVALASVMPLAAFAQTTGGVGTMNVVPAYPGIGPANPVPGGLTLVPGTVVTPGVGGSAVTGTVPLAGTVGSPGVGNFNPGLMPNPNTSGNTGALYPPAIYSQGLLPGVQSTLPQSGPAAGAPPTIANCPAGITSPNGTC